MALEMCTASGVCTGVAGTAALTTGGFVAGTTKDLVIKIYHYSRARFDGMMKDKYEEQPELRTFYIRRQAYHYGRYNEIQLSRDRVIKAMALGIFLALALYFASRYL